LTLLVGFLIVLSGAPLAAEEAAAARELLYRNGFEAGEAGLSRWWDNGPFTVNFAGLSEERAFKGKSSFKLDVTFRTGTSCYWQGTRFYIPLKSSPTVRCALYIQQGKAALGFGLNAGASGMCGGGFRQVRADASGWTEWESANKPSLVEMDHLEWLAIYVSGGNGERVVLFVDECEIEGTPFPALSKKIEEQIQSAAASAQKEAEVAFQRRLGEVQKQFKETQQLRTRTRRALPDTAAAWVRKIDEQLSAYSEKAFADLAKELERLAAQGSSAGELQPLREQLRYLAFALNSSYSLPDFVDAYGDRPYLVYGVPPIRNEKITPTCFPVPGVVGDAVSLSACPDEYAPASFALYAAADLNDVGVVASALVGSSPSSKEQPAPKGGPVPGEVLVAGGAVSRQLRPPKPRSHSRTAAQGRRAC
jgi:hypothetical protein